MNITTALTPAQVEQYHRDGYLIVPDLLSPSEVEEFVRHNAELGSGQPTYGLQGHQQDEIYRKVAHHPAIVGPVAQLIQGQPEIVQTMYTKRPKVDRAPRCIRIPITSATSRTP